MGTPGKAWDMPKSAIEAALKKHKGIIQRACKELSCAHGCLEKAIKKDSELSQLLIELRRGKADEFIEQAEDFLFATINECKDPKVTLNAAFFILNTNDLAKEHFWGNRKDEKDSTNESLSTLLALEKKNFAVQAELQACRNALKAAGVPLPEGFDKSQSADQSQS